jgi:predicted RNA-binding Zn-ribbon protein involved in translation (DUF1610 family)
MSRKALLKILCSEKTKVDQNKVCSVIRKMGYTNIRSENDPVPQKNDYQLVVWLQNTAEKLTEADISKLVGGEGNVLYLWQCPKCGTIIRQCEHLKEKEFNYYSGCTCPISPTGQSLLPS